MHSQACVFSVWMFTGLPMPSTFYKLELQWLLPLCTWKSLPGPSQTHKLWPSKALSSTSETLGSELNTTMNRETKAQGAQLVKCLLCG